MGCWEGVWEIGNQASGNYEQEQGAAAGWKESGASRSLARLSEGRTGAERPSVTGLWPWATGVGGEAGRQISADHQHHCAPGPYSEGAARVGEMGRCRAP